MAKRWPERRAACLILISVGFMACGVRGETGAAPVLLFDGAGASRNDVAAIEDVLDGQHLRYSTLSRIDEAKLRGSRLLIVPGGNFVDIGNGLGPAAAVNIRSAVQSGLNYLGICAGAFLAGNSPYNGLNLTSGVRFGFYAAEARGIRKAALPIAVAGAPTLEHYWEDGPQLSGWGDVVGRYPDGTPAIVEGAVGSGWVILTGIHPEAPENWRRGMTFATPASADNAFAGTVIQAALDRTPLAHF